MAASRLKLRLLKDRLTTVGMGVGGISVIIAIVLIFFYLLYVVYPLFIPADMEKVTGYSTPDPDAGNTVMLAIEEQNEVGTRFTDQAKAVFFNAHNGTRIKTEILPHPRNTTASSFAADQLTSSIVAWGLNDGQAIVAKHVYNVSYGSDKRTITPALEYPLGKTPLLINKKRTAVKQIAIAHGEEETSIVALTAENKLLLSHFQPEEGLFDEDEAIPLTNNIIELPDVANVKQLLVNSEQRILYLLQASDEITLIDISDKSAPEFLGRVRVTPENTKVTSLKFMTGGISLLIGTQNGQVSQWFPVNQEEGIILQKVRTFETIDGSVTDIMTEQRRKGFVTATENGMVSVHHSTAQRTLVSEKITDTAIRHITVSPRSDSVITEDQTGRFQFWHITNEHPEISWDVLWGKVWYESYPEPSYTWQSSSASNDFEPKYSLMPLAFGTLKAAFYAMLFAIPLAIMGAIYTAYFMAPKMRTYVKPSIEIMEALPTVILGFLAGLWLAPTIENNLPGIFSLLVLLPPGVLLFAWLWQQLPTQIRHRIPDGWQAALLIPVIFIIGWFAISISQPLEVLLFSGDMRQWLGNEMGMDFDQRNSMVVGIAMGVAVIPTIFSIAEDAIFSVPKHLTFGSLALGATPWQTMVRVVILTASPGIFSAVMIGFGRAVGETMIVLMATGNTPVMDFSIFQGMRTLSANIAVEMPESEVDSTHYRVLFLAALVLFMFTFLFNTIAEVVRQRLRLKYSSL